MIYREIETTTDEVLEFIKNAGIDIESTSDVNAFRIRMPDGSIVEMHPDFNVFGDMFEDSYERHQAELAKTRAEVEQLKAIIDRLEQEKAELLVSEIAEFRIPMEIAYRVRTEHPIVKAIKLEVAREIFADLEQYGICEQLYMGGVCLIEQEFEELKKKYGVE